jgi:catechol 2,3-dioxygenase-like lactoylglutathione lyase family enzyme
MKWICLIALFGSAPWSQAASNDGDAAAAEILNDIHAVNSLDKTLAFYEDVFGLDGQVEPFTSRGFLALTNSPGARVRLAVIHLPNTSFGLELMECSGVERKPARLRVSDPGASHLILRVRDLNRVVDAAKKSGAEIVTPSGAPVQLPATAVGTRAILMRDPDGYFVEGEEVASSNGSPSNGNVQSAGMRFAMAERNATLKFYGDLLGFKLTGRTEFRVNPAMTAFTGVPQGSQSRGLNVAAAGTNPLVFYEVKDLPQTRLRLRLPDPGVPAISFRVKDLDGLLKRMRAADVPIVSARGRLVRFTPRTRSIFVEDPNGINVELYEAVEKFGNKSEKDQKHLPDNNQED